MLGDHTKSKLHEATCGVVARLFKFVLPDYWGEILHETKEWVRRKLVVLSWEQREPESESAVRRLQQLYTKHVISDSCCELLNGGLNPPTHICAPGVDPETVRAKLATRVYEYIVKDLYVVDEKPTLTRMFTYRDCADHCLTLSWLNVPAGCFRLRKNVRQTTQKRLKIIQNFFKNQHAPQLLRRTSLGLQITGGVVAMTCKKDESHASEAKRMSCSALLPEDVLSASLIYAHRQTRSNVLSAPSDVLPAPSGACSSVHRPVLSAPSDVLLAPSGACSSVPRPEMTLLVKLCCGEAQSLAAERRIAILSNLHCDPSLDVGATISVLLGAEVEIHVRFEKYRRYPFRLCFLMGIWFPVGYLASIKTFLKAARNLLDLGLSFPLQLFAIAQGGFDAAVDFLMS